MESILKWVDKNRSGLYFGFIILFFVLAVIYATKGYLYHHSLSDVKNGNDLLGRIFSPFVLATIRFLVVMLLGIFVTMILLSTPLKRIKVMQFEVEFDEIAKTQVKQLNQFHFLFTVLKEYETLIGWGIDKEDNAFKYISESILNKYENLLDSDLNISISTDVCEYSPGKNMFSKPEFNRIAERIVLETDEEKQYITKKRFGKSNILMATKEYYGKKIVVLMESDDYVFSDYDKEALKSILEYAINICKTVDLLQ